MILLIAFAFLAGIITILSPCILPILPIILTSTIGGQEIGKSRPLGVVIGFVLSFTFFTLFLSTIVRLSGISADLLRLLSVVVIAGFGASLLIPQFQVLMERLFSKLTGFLPQGQNRTGFGGGLLIGLSLGLLWTPCVGPILASVISLALSGTVTFDAFLITLAYSLGTAIPMFLIMLGGQNILRRVPWLLANTGNIQKGFGILMILTAVGIFFNVDRQFQTYILNTFPTYGVGLTQFEDNEAVRNQLKNINDSDVQKEDIGKPMDTVQDAGTKAPELITGGQWFNSEPLTITSLKGKVILIDFWTYTCINCIRTLPYLKDWHEKYKDEGFVIIGVHTPEFEFEKDAQNVKNAIKDFGITYPVMQDNDYATWRAYDNHYWPAKYLINKDGNIVYTHFGEGAYSETEKKIQELLQEAGKTVTEEVSTITDQTPKMRLTPETYLGSWRMEYYFPDRNLRDGKKNFTLSEDIPSNTFSLGGEWMIAYQYSMAGKDAELLDNFYAQKVFLVMRPPEGVKDAKVRVWIDGNLASDQNAGEDVDPKTGIVSLDTDRLYELVNFDGTVSNHVLRLEFITPGIEVFAFTYG